MIVVLKYLVKAQGRAILETKQWLQVIVFVQYIFRFGRFYPLTSDLKKTAGSFADSAWLGAAYYLLWYLLASHIAGALWYLLAVERNDTCWQLACQTQGDKCNDDFLFCGNHDMVAYESWRNISVSVLDKICNVEDIGPTTFNFGIYTQAISSKIVETQTFFVKFWYCLWWGLQNLSTLGQGLQTSTYPGEIIFCIVLAINGLILFALLIGNMQVPLFTNMDERLLDAICERLKPSLYTELSFIVREGDPVDEMIFIIRGHLESVTTDGGRSGFYNRGLLKEGDFCGEELLTWALDPKSSFNLPLSTRTVEALTEVEAFALRAEELKFVATQFRRLHSKQVQHTFRFYSQQWKTWASCFIQAAWRRHMKRKIAELRRLEEEEESHRASGDDDGGSNLVTSVYVSRFAKNVLRGVHRLRSGSSTTGLSLQKPAEPDFSKLD